MDTVFFFFPFFTEKNCVHSNGVQLSTAKNGLGWRVGSEDNYSHIKAIPNPLKNYDITHKVALLEHMLKKKRQDVMSETA